jgi:hypoxanthine-guanine phosphoribosyltransferase
MKKVEGQQVQMDETFIGKEYMWIGILHQSMMFITTMIMRIIMAATKTLMIEMMLKTMPSLKS